MSRSDAVGDREAAERLAGRLAAVIGGDAARLAAKPCAPMPSPAAQNASRQALRLLVVLSLSIFVTEAAIMFALHEFIGHDPTFEAILDATLLTLILSPILYLFVVSRLVRSNLELSATKASLHATNTRLEQRIMARTFELESSNRNLYRSLERLTGRQREMAALGRMGRLFQLCQTVDEACRVTRNRLQDLFPEVCGAVILSGEPPGERVQAIRWGNDEAWAAADAQDTLCGPCCGEKLAKVLCGERRVCHSVDKATAQWYLCLSLRAHKEVVGTLSLKGPVDPSLENERQFIQDRVQFYVAVAENLALAIANIRLREQLRQRALRDPLTGLHNRRYLLDALEREVARAAREDEPLSVALVDIDRFKHVNDTFGHDAGDAVLTALAELLRNAARAHDVVARYGGEEFVIVLPGASRDAALRRTEDLRRRVEALSLGHRGRSLGPVTVSIGVTCQSAPQMSVESLLHAADFAMYRSKQAGRNRVSYAETETDADSETGEELAPTGTS